MATLAALAPGHVEALKAPIVEGFGVLRRHLLRVSCGSAHKHKTGA